MTSDEVIRVEIPGQPLELTTLLLDLNGTLTLDGVLLEGVEVRLAELRESMRIEFASGDTFGTARDLAMRLSLPVTLVPDTGQAAAKQQIVGRLGPEHTAMIGNGANDARALAAAALGICIVGPEGAARAALLAADVIVTDPLVALDLLLNPRRLLGTLRT